MLASAYPRRLLQLSALVVFSPAQNNRHIEFVQELDNFIIVTGFMPGVLRLLRPTRETPRAIASSSVLPKQPGVGCGVLTTTHPSGRLTPWFPAGRLETFVSRPDPNLGFDTKSNPIPKCVIDVRTHGRNVDNRTGKARRQHPAIFWRVFHESARGSTRP